MKKNLFLLPFLVISGAAVLASCGQKYEFDTIADVKKVTADSEDKDFTIRGKVVAKNLRGILVQDHTGIIQVYLNDTTISNYAIGDWIEVQQALTLDSYNPYHGNVQFTNAAKITKLEANDKKNPKVEELVAKEITSTADFDALDGSITYVSMKAYLFKSGNYVNFTLDGAEHTGSFTYADSSFNLDANHCDTYFNVTYFVTGISGTRIDAMVESATAVEKTAPTSVTIGTAASEMIVGDDLQLSVTAAPKASVATVNWSSSNNEIATVDATGKVHAVAQGEVVITATSTAAATVKNTKTITVNPIPVATAVAIDGGAEVQVGKTLQLSASVTPAKAVQDVVWTSANNEIATVDENGLVTGVALGTVKIKATAKDLDTVYIEKDIEVKETVAAATNDPITVAGASVDSFASSYADYTGTVGGVSFSFAGCFKADNGGIQMRTSSNSTISNTTALPGNIATITVTFSKSADMTVKLGATATTAATTNLTVTAKGTGETVIYTPTVTDAKFFSLTCTAGTVITGIVIAFAA